MPRWSVVVDRDGTEPVYAQIARQVRAFVASGDLKAGAPLPSVRTLAGDLGVNLNTVARAYRRLEEEGFVEILDRSGVRVAPPGALLGSRDTLRERLREVLARFKQAGVSAHDIRKITSKEIAALHDGEGRE